MAEKQEKNLTKEQIEFTARNDRVWKAIRLEKHDRVPISILDDYFSLSLGGLTPRDAYYDPERASKVFVEEVIKFNWDMVSMFGTFPGLGAGPLHRRVNASRNCAAECADSRAAGCRRVPRTSLPIPRSPRVESGDRAV